MKEEISEEQVRFVDRIMATTVKKVEGISSWLTAALSSIMIILMSGREDVKFETIKFLSTKVTEVLADESEALGEMVDELNSVLKNADSEWPDTLSEDTDGR